MGAKVRDRDHERSRRLGRLIAAHRLILFDLDDTLCDYSLARLRRLTRTFEDMFRAAGQPPPGDLAGLIARSIATDPHGVDHLPDLLADYRLSAETIVAGQRWYRANRFHELALFARTTAALAAVRQQPGVAGRRTGIITNGPAEVQRAKVDLLGVEPLVDFVVISGEFGAEKPDPAIFGEALRLGDVPAADALYVGDSSEHDVAGAHAAGLTAVWVNRNGEPWVGAGTPPDAEIRDIAEIAQAITTVARHSRTEVPERGRDRSSGYT